MVSLTFTMQRYGAILTTNVNKEKSAKIFALFSLLTLVVKIAPYLCIVKVRETIELCWISEYIFYVV